MEFSLNNKEKQVISALYTLESSSVSLLSKQTLINRTTLYPILEKLLRKGLITKLELENTTIYEPISQSDFREWLKNKEKEAKNQLNSLSSWLKEQKNQDKGSLLSEIKYFDGKEGLKALYADTWRENSGKEILAITDYKQAYNLMGREHWREYFKMRVKKGVNVKNLLPPSVEGKEDVEDSKEYLREMKFIKIFEDLGIEINVYDNKVSIASFDEEHPNGVLIQNRKIAEAFKNIFQFLWKKN